MSSTVNRPTDNNVAVATAAGDYDWRLAAHVDVAREIRATRCRLDAQQVRLFASAYETAQRRSARSKSAPNDRIIRSVDGDAFACQLRSIMGEFAVALRASDVALCNRAHDAHELVTGFPTWVDELDAAVIELAHASAMLREGSGVPRENYSEYGDEVLDYAKTPHSGPDQESRREGRR